MQNHPQHKEVANRAMRELGVPLWEDGPSLQTLVDRFAGVAVEAVNLDSWIPLASPKTQPVVAYFFQGFALRLADRLIVHPKVAMLALVFASINHIFAGKPIEDTTKLITGLQMPRLDGVSKAEGFHMLGVQAADQWVDSGLETKPPMKQLVVVIGLIEKYAVEDAKNPGGAADLASKLMRLNDSAK